MTNQDFYKGQKVIFGRPNGEQTHGTVIKVNAKSVKVRQDESRGTYKDHEVGATWRVAKSLCRPANGETVAAPKRSEAEIMRDIRNVYNQLSPENLHCDGEISMSQARRKAAVLNRQLGALQAELGRKVSECEAYVDYL